MVDPLGFRKVVPAYWLYYRRFLLWAALALVPWFAVVVTDRLGLPKPAWANGAAMILTYAVLGWLVFGLPFRQRRVIVRVVNQAGDLARVCSRCLYISDAIAEGDPCPECGRSHPPNLGEKWIFTGHKLNDKYLFKKLVRDSAVLTESGDPAPSASAAAADRQD